MSNPIQNTLYPDHSEPVLSVSDSEDLLFDLSPQERTILQCLSIFWVQITSSEMYNLLRSLEIRTPEGRLYTGPNISLMRRSFLQKGVICETVEYWGKGFQISSPELKERLTREAMRESRFEEVVRIIQAEYGRQHYGWSYRDYENNIRLLRDYRLSIYRQKLDEAAEFYKQIEQKGLEREASEIIVRIFSYPFQKEFLAKFDLKLQAEVLQMLMEKAFASAEPIDEFLEFARENDLDHEWYKGFEALVLILNGEISKAKGIIVSPDSPGRMLTALIAATLEKDYENAVVFGDEAIKGWRKILNKKKGFPGNWQMFFYGLALYKTDEVKFHKFTEDFRSYSVKNYPGFTVPRAIGALARFLTNDDAAAKAETNQIGSSDFFEQLVWTIAVANIPRLPLPDFAKEFEVRNRELGYRWPLLEIANLLSSRQPSNTEAKETVEKLQTALGFEPLGNLVPRFEAWERALKTLTLIAEEVQSKVEHKKTSRNETRIAWLLSFEYNEIQPVEQKYVKGAWSGGRNIALKRLYTSDVNNLTEQDRLAVKVGLKKYRDYYSYGGETFEFDWEKTIAVLTGHPLLFLDKSPRINIRLDSSEPSLVIKQIKDDLELSFDAEFSAEGVAIQKETETRYKVLNISKHHVDILNSLKKGKLRIPAIGRERLLKAIQPLSTKIAIQSDIEEHYENLPLVEAENRIHALFTSVGDGFHLELFAKPFGSVPPYFKPGKESESVIADLNGVRTRTKRDLNNERKLLDEIEELCPSLAESESLNYEWDLTDAEACLTVMTEMEAPRKDGKLLIEWIKGQKLRLLGNIGFDNFSMSVKGTSNWFQVEGKAEVSEDLVLSIRELNKLLDQETKKFIELSDGQFIAITEKLRKYLRSLHTVLDEKGRLHNLRAGILEEFSDELESFKADKAWKQQREKLKDSQNFVPQVPTTFQAELRPYQIDGYNWLARLVHWGVGACLADDMGLGKTLQALAIMVDRAEKGPALVVAPVSVCRNWVKEAMRFAPTLNFQIFGGGDRETAIAGLGKYDVLVTSYSLLQSEEALFAGKKFATIVLDEAQAIKNRQTKRSRAVMALQGDFRLITTGTPIENHLGELWNLFNFINPGLLGSHEFFNERFALPIEKNRDENSRKTLQKLIMPFVLRRRKNQVLDDLPPKTEITLTVEMSPEERAFYEALRREAIEKIESEAGEAKDKRFRILAELTRLRLACCHPKLVNENIPIGSSKLELFGETLEELLENKHKALVFSQFVKHLKIAEEYLRDKGISYHYLDGSTPQHIRQERIDAFQRGQGDVFLISLRAGGTGLNLTAADYVIHLDPWWNPAVEDQASDRVHRIGQQRPVTVYRFVTEDTVEEKILKLHETKRDLADSLLDGTDSSGKLSAEDLLALITEI